MTPDVNKLEERSEENRGPDWKPRPQGTWLVVPYDAADVGARPAPNGDPVWTSTAIKVIGGDALGNPTGGSPVSLEARILNYGALDAAPVRVDFAFVAPSLGILPGAPELIGTAWTSVPAGQATSVPCPVEWTPPTYPTDLHACLLVTCSAPGQNDIPTAPANPVADRHVGQHNLTVLEAGGAEAMALRLNLANLEGREASVEIAAAAAWLFELPGREKVGLLPHLGARAAIQVAARARSLEQARLWTRRAALVDVEAREAKREILEAGEVREIVRVASLRAGKTMRPSGALMPPAGRTKAGGEAFTTLEGKLELAPAQMGTVELELRVPKSDYPVLSVHLAQSIDGRIDGGYTLLIDTRRGKDRP